ncbi:ABC transporter ATP-binding protein, partial [bacterium]|nr:ABC transporter ATP-binding protein [candidate division CSSED10-310 bacterium]
MLAVERLVVRYGPRTALDSVNVEFTPDRVIALTGPNGSGKSTLIQAIAGLIRPVSGRILWKGTDTTGCIHRDIGVLLQRPVLLAGSVKTNVEYGLKLRKIPHRERRTRVRDALTAVGALDLLHRSRRSLSGGEIQRVALARTLALNPSCLMLDEPFAHLDRAGIQALSAILTRLHGQGILLIIATHQEMPGHALGAHIVALQHGRIAVPEIRNVLRGTSYTTNNRRFLRLDTGIVLEHTEP